MKYATYQEYLQLPEFRAVCSIVANRSRNKCELCEQRIAVDFHHVRYCKWGEVDTENNLLHLCRECHERAHSCSKCGCRIKSDAIKEGRTTCRKCMHT